ncbi:mechanosensitive ion channel family protein [Halogeometricum borinquense]|uniref:Mechanosensitive ion channel family protein n=1 Tax=Halogeometricum borinquense TaxID=60847 RepID=A0A6C0UHH8_9EURY|nr:mechanosensitive ion channel family protein [Halogeometricum borinquense]QIB74942.1 mechanosensitive ion channel family protein [Halogeometricum borinquense]QIQ76058.1 mechanosensitive ion channel family protein [Halogeometricum borinquense]
MQTGTGTAGPSAGTETAAGGSTVGTATTTGASSGGASTATPPPTPTEGVQAARALLPDFLFFPGAEYVAATVIVILGYVLSGYVVRLVGRPVARRFRRQSVAQVMLRIVRLGVFLVAVLIAGVVAGLRFGDVAISVGVFSAVVGIVLAPIVGSIINGLFILADQPYEVGDMIELDDGRRGFVDEITIRYTKMFTLDNTFLVIPNSTIRNRLVTNFSAEDERLRLSLGFLATYESDIPKARELLERAASDSDMVIEGGPDIRIGSARYPARPTAYIDEYADSGILITLRYWAKKPYKVLTVRSEVQTNLYELLEDEPAVEAAYPHQHHVFDDTSGSLRAAVTDGRDESWTEAGMHVDRSPRSEEEQ